MNYVKYRPLIICWLYFMSVGHFIGGAVLSWLIQLPAFARYHQLILHQFGLNDASINVLELQVWWIKLFGATLQNFAIYMAVLIYVGNRTRMSAIWGWMIFGLLIWVVQDMYISAQREIWMHLWIDGFALLLILPPLIILWRNDVVERLI